MSGYLYVMHQKHDFAKKYTCNGILITSKKMEKGTFFPQYYLFQSYLFSMGKNVMLTNEDQF